MDAKTILTITGGIGLFLLGMTLMTDGLKTLAGDSLRKALGRFTGGRISAVLSGAAVTAFIQSSGATTFATIGFVSAGIISFQQSIGIILGANLGTTSTSWIVTYLGLKFKVSIISYPIIAVGALLKLLGKHRMAAVGIILAGFGMIFVGIDLMQEGMTSTAASFNLSALPDSTLIGKIGLLAVGVAMTIVMQSSSAAMAATLAALSTDTITLTQAAIMAIGQNIGTTAISALGAIGATTPAKRTALAHVLFNIAVGTGVFILLPWFITLSRAFAELIGNGENIITLSAFHTLFNLIGILAVLPFTGAFASLITRMLPERGLGLTKNLDSSVLMVPQVAIEAARLTLVRIAGYIINHLAAVFRGHNQIRKTPEVLDNARQALIRTQSFLGEIRSFNNSPLLHERHSNIIHSIDHLYRLIGACRETNQIGIIMEHGDMNRIALLLVDNAESIHAWLQGDRAVNPRETAEKTSVSIAEIRKNQRRDILNQTSSGQIDADTAFALMESVRWLDRIAFHVWRAVIHLEDIKTASPPETAGELHNGTLPT